MHTPLNPASREAENLEGWMAKHAESPPLKRMAQARGGARFPPLSRPPRRPRPHHQTRPPAPPAQPSEVGPAFVFLASGESSFITGQTIHVDGGMFVGS